VLGRQQKIHALSKRSWPITYPTDIVHIHLSPLGVEWAVGVSRLSDTRMVIIGQRPPGECMRLARTQAAVGITSNKLAEKVCAYVDVV
jgi:hypothetical protein